jgi:C_GCAxxG_C_C family probable redox protein
MGHLQGTCGAVTGAYLLISLKYGNIAKEDNLAKEKTHALVREFARLFEEKNKTTNCLELLNVDIINGDKQIVAEKFSMVCPKIVQDAAEILENILF